MKRLGIFFLSSLLLLPACSPTEAAGVAGLYDIDAKASAQRAGMLAGVVEALLKGSTLTLEPDMTFVGEKAGVREMEGTWEIANGKLTMNQTHEKGKPSKDTGTGTIVDGVVTVAITKSGVPLSLMFRRQGR